MAGTLTLALLGWIVMGGMAYLALRLLILMLRAVLRRITPPPVP